MYQPEREMIMCESNTAASSILSNLTGTIKEFLLNLFPKGYIKNTFITTEQGSSQSNQQDIDDVFIKKVPLLSINPSISLGSSEALGNPYPIWRRGLMRYFKPNRLYGYKCIFGNDKDDIYLWAVPNRIKLLYEMKIKVNTHMEKIDLVYFLRNKFDSSERFYLNQKKLESQLPNSIVASIAAIKGYDLKDPDSIIDMLDYLKTFSSGYITLKRNLATGNPTFYFNYLANILVAVEDAPNADTGNIEKNNMSDAGGEVSFTLSFELWIPNCFMFQCLERPIIEETFDNPQFTTVTLNMTMNRSLTRGNRSEVSFQSFITEANVKYDSLDITPMFNREHRKLIELLLSRGDIEKLHHLYEIVIYRDDKILREYDEYKFDWKTKTVTLLNPYYNYTYAAGIYVDYRLFNETIEKEKIRLDE